MYRKLATAFGVAAVAVSTLSIAAPASAECSSDGSIPGGNRTVYGVGAGNGTRFYVDDRDYLDLDDDGQAGGIWIYQEANGNNTLETGGAQFVMAMIPGQAPEIQPRPGGLPIFPNGFGGGSWAETLGGYDSCFTGSTTLKDRVWF